MSDNTDITIRVIIPAAWSDTMATFHLEHDMSMLKALVNWYSK